MKQLNIDDVMEYYKTHSTSDSAKHYGLSRLTFCKYLDRNSINRHDRKTEFALTSRNKRSQLVTREELSEYYSVHTNRETAEHFNLSAPALAKLLVDYDIESRSHAEAIALGVQHKYGVSNVMQLDTSVDSYKATCLDRYGVTNYFKTVECKEKLRATCNQRYGVNYSGQIPSKIAKTRDAIYNRYGGYRKIRDKAENTCLERYGVKQVLKTETSLEKMRSTCLERYGVSYPCMREEAKLKGNNSLPNRLFELDLIERGILDYVREFSLSTYCYDFKVGNTLIEINPSITHNSSWTPFGKPVQPLYHQNKSLTALSAGYNFVAIWDWDDRKTVLDLIISQSPLDSVDLSKIYHTSSQIIDSIERGRISKPCTHYYDLSNKMVVESASEHNVVCVYDCGNILT